MVYSGYMENQPFLESCVLRTQYIKIREQKKPLEKALSLTHCRLDVKRLDVLPVLLQQRDKEVHGKHDVSRELVLGHLDMTDSHTKTQNLLQLELDGRLHVSHLLFEVLGVRDRRGELSCLRETRTQKTWNLLDQSVRRQESVVLLGELLHKLLVLVELLQVINGHEVKRDQLRAVNVRSVSQNAERHAGARHVWEPHCTTETLVTLRVVVLQTNLQLDGLVEVALLFFSALQHITDGRSHT